MTSPYFLFGWWVGLVLEASRRSVHASVYRQFEIEVKIVNRAIEDSAIDFESRF